MIIQKKIVVCGSVDDGKSTLVGRIYYDTKNIFEDQLNKIKLTSKKQNQEGIGNNLDLAFFNDGLSDEIKQGITIDVSHKFLNTNSERFIFHDSPGHNQYTRNVVTAASECDLAIVLVDLTKGILDQTKKHIQILNFLNIKNIIFALNKIDLIQFNKKKYDLILNELKKYLLVYSKIKFNYVPISALKGINVVKSAEKKKWYSSTSIFDLLKKIKVKNNLSKYNFFSIQHLIRKNGKRFYFGQISGKIKKKEKYFIFPSEEPVTILNIYNNFKKKKLLVKKNFACIEFENYVDAIRGNILASKNDNILVGNNFNASVVIVSKESLHFGREYILRLNNQEEMISVNKIKGIYDHNNNLIAKNKLETNELGQIEFSSRKKIIFSDSNKIPELNKFILIDSFSNSTIAAGTINFKLNRSENIFPSEGKINKSYRANIKKQVPVCIWLTGRSGSGKTTIAQKIEEKLSSRGMHTYVLDGDNLRIGLNKDLGFKDSDRIENVRRVSEVAKLFVDAGVIVIVSLISPFKKDRLLAKKIFEKNEFFEIHVNTPIAVCAKRDPKKLYLKTKKDNKISKVGLTGIYEEPDNPFLRVSTEKNNADYQAEKIIKKIIFK